MDAILETLEVAAVTAQKESISEEWRVRLLSAASKLVTALQRPEETVMRESFWMGRSMALRVLQDLSVFDHITAKGRITSAELAETVKADRTLLERFLRVMTASGYVVELDEATYGPNQLTRALTNRQMKGMVEGIFDGGMETMGKMPAYLAETGYKNPDDQADGPLQYRYGAQGQDFFQILVARPKLLSAFSNFFEGDRGGRPDWVDWFPVQEKLLDDLRRPIAPDSILYVDVAGGRGHDLLAFKKKFDHVPGKYYLFDVPHIVDDLTLDLGDRVQRVAFDFFQDQVISSMSNPSSQLIIEDFILPPTGAALLPTLFDMQMITFLAGMERTEKQWCALLGKAGLIVDGFYQPPGDGTGIIVTQLK